MKNEDRIRVFKETVKVKYTSKSIVIKELLNINEKPKIIFEENNTVKRILDISQKYNNISVLNFADPFDAGGLVWQGVDTQEECLCRCSTLYKALLQDEPQIEFYKYNLKLNKTTNRVIYSPRVLFFRDSDYKFLDKNNVKFVNVISCAAPYYNEFLNDEEIKARMKQIIAVSAYYKNDCLILGRWGCGAFENDWNKFQQLWNEVIMELDF